MMADSLRDRLAEALTNAALTKALDEIEGDTQWYVDQFVVDCDTATLMGVLADAVASVVDRESARLRRIVAKQATILERVGYEDDTGTTQAERETAALRAERDEAQKRFEQQCARGDDDALTLLRYFGENSRLRAELADLRAQAAVPPEDWREQIREAVEQPEVFATSTVVDSVAALIESWRFVPDNPTVSDTYPTPEAREDTQTAPNERYVDIHHLVEAELQIARLTKDSAGRPVEHHVTEVAKAVAYAFDMDLTPEAEAATQRRHSPMPDGMASPVQDGGHHDGG